MLVRLRGRGLTLRSSGPATAGHAWPSFHSGPSVACRSGPLTSNVRPLSRESAKHDSPRSNWGNLGKSPCPSVVAPLQLAQLYPCCHQAVAGRNRGESSRVSRGNRGSSDEKTRRQGAELKVNSRSIPRAETQLIARSCRFRHAGKSPSRSIEPGSGVSGMKKQDQYRVRCPPSAVASSPASGGARRLAGASSR